MTPEEKVEKLSWELARTRYVWNQFIHNLCHGLYPKRKMEFHVQNAPFEGRDEEKILEIFKVMDYEIRRIRQVAEGMGIDINTIRLDHPALFDEISKATGITEHSHG